MQIRLRPSGGRGEYELAGSHGAVRGADLYGLDLVFEFGLDLRIPLYAIADVHDGKPRIRLSDPHSSSHAAKVIAALLLLPQPIREIRLTSGTDTDVDFGRCAYSSIVVDVVYKDTSKAILRPRTIVALNGLGAKETIDVLNRFEFIKSIWARNDFDSTEWLDAIANHQSVASAASIDHRTLIKAAEKVLVLPGALTLLNPRISLPPSEEAGLITPSSLSEDDPTSPIEVNREIRKKLAWRVERGAEGLQFRRAINGAYGYRCAFTGARLPPLDKGFLPGVDAAHIYPWSRNGTNDVTNGISLSKQMHWAFDEGILRLQYASLEDSTLLIDVPADIEKMVGIKGFDLDAFKAVCGPIPEQHLPFNRNQWPSRKSLDLYNELMFPLL
jgi:hypothetical protein